MKRLRYKAVFFAMIGMIICVISCKIKPVNHNATDPGPDIVVKEPCQSSHRWYAPISNTPNESHEWAKRQVKQADSLPDWEEFRDSTYIEVFNYPEEWIMFDNVVVFSKGTFPNEVTIRYTRGDTFIHICIVSDKYPGDSTSNTLYKNPE